MTINRRNTQEKLEPFIGAELIKMADVSTGSKMMTVADLTVQPGISSSYHKHPNSEESIFIVKGDMEFRVGNHKFPASSGDCILAPRGTGHGLKNVGSSVARLICVYPVFNPEREEIQDPEFKFNTPPDSVFVRSENENFEFFPGISRYDMVGDFVGSESTYFSELTFAPGSIAPNHFHPAHEESMFCLEGNLTAVYDNEDAIDLDEGDIFTCEVGIRHGIYNRSNKVGKLLAIHPVLNPPPRIDVD